VHWQVLQQIVKQLLTQSIYISHLGRGYAIIFAIPLADCKEIDYFLVFHTGLGEKNQHHRDIDLNIELIHIRGTGNATTLVTVNQGNL
jgi:hypothetical protein